MTLHKDNFSNSNLNCKKGQPVFILVKLPDAPGRLVNSIKLTSAGSSEAFVWELFFWNTMHVLQWFHIVRIKNISGYFKHDYNFNLKAAIFPIRVYKNRI